MYVRASPVHQSKFLLLEGSSKAVKSIEHAMVIHGTSGLDLADTSVRLLQQILIVIPLNIADRI